AVDNFQSVPVRDARPPSFNLIQKLPGLHSGKLLKQAAYYYWSSSRSKESFQASGQALPRRFTQVDDLLPRQIEQLGNSRVVERQSIPKLGESLGRHLERLGELPQRGDARHRKERQTSAPVDPAQIEQQSRPLRARQFTHFFPQPLEKDALFDL